MGLFAKTPKTKGGLNNNLKNNRTPSALIEPFLKFSKKITLTHTLSLSSVMKKFRKLPLFYS